LEFFWERLTLAKSGSKPRRSEGRSRSSEPRERLSPEKGTEILGILLCLVALLGGLSLATYYPRDPSLFQHATESEGIRNWIGPFGAHLSALVFATIGISGLALPILLSLAAWRRLRTGPSVRVVGRGFGAIVLLAALPGLLQLTLEQISWRGELISSGGGFGKLLAKGLSTQLGGAGALLLLTGGVIVGAALVAQSTLGEILTVWRGHLSERFSKLSLWWARRQEREHKVEQRRRVTEKQLARAEEKQSKKPVIRSMASEVKAPEAPIRVKAKKGDAGFSVRKVAGTPDVEPEVAAAVAQKKAAPTAPARPVSKRAPKRATKEPKEQQAIPFKPQPGGSSDLPPLNLLKIEAVRASAEPDELVRLGEVIRSRCAEFGVEGSIEGISPGPVITVFEFQPAPGVKVSQIVNLQDDLALSLKADAIRIDRMAGRSTLGIEVPNSEQAIIRLGHLLDQDPFRKSPSKLTVALGTTIQGEPYFSDLAKMPHLLVAGATGAGKSVGLQSMITSILYKAKREEVQFIFIDPKRIELGVYADIPHLKTEVVVDMKKAANALRWAVAEMERRYRLLAEVHVRSIDFYNRAILDPKVRERLSLSDDGESPIDMDDLKPLPYYVVVIDELADLMMVSSSEVEASIARLAQMARAVGIHLIIATQRPSVDVLTGTIKANFPCRIAFATASRHDSRTILDQIGAEKLLGRGDMLFMPPGSSRVVRLHGAYISEQETAGLIRWLKKQGRPELDRSILEAPKEERGSGGGGANDDEMFDTAARLVVAERQASASFLQRRLRVGFSRASRLIDLMEQDGLLGPPQGSKPREVLVPPDYFIEVDETKAEV